MTCRAARRLLSLFAGGDLKGPKMSAVVGHVSACAACRAEVEAFTAARSLLPLSTLSFGEAERALVRRHVLDEIARRRENPAPFAGFVLRPRFALAVLAGALVLAASLVSPYFVRSAVEPAAVLLARPVPSEALAPVIERVAEAAPAQDRSTATLRVPRTGKAPRPPVRASEKAGPAMRFEIQTGNVNVRIIWFVGGNSAEKPSSGPAEDPNGLS